MRWIVLVPILALSPACSSSEVEEGPLHDYLLAGREPCPAAPPAEVHPVAEPAPEPAAPVASRPDAGPPTAPEAAVEPRPIAPAPPGDEAPAPPPFFEKYLGEYRYDVVKNVIFPIKGGDVVYRFRKVEDPKAYAPFPYYLEFEFHVKGEGPGLLFMDEARFVAHSVWDGERLRPRRLRIGLVDGSFRHFVTYDLDEANRKLRITDEIRGVSTLHDLEQSDTMDPITFFFNLFCLGIDFTQVKTLHGHLMHEDESPILVVVDQEEKTAEVSFRPGEFLPKKSSKFRFFFDERGKIDVERFELEYGAWSMKMELVAGEVPK